MGDTPVLLAGFHLRGPAVSGYGQLAESIIPCNGVWKYQGVNSVRIVTAVSTPKFKALLAAYIRDSSIWNDFLHTSKVLNLGLHCTYIIAFDGESANKMRIGSRASPRLENLGNCLSPGWISELLEQSLCQPSPVVRNRFTDSWIDTQDQGFFPSFRCRVCSYRSVAPVHPESTGKEVVQHCYICLQRGATRCKIDADEDNPEEQGCIAQYLQQPSDLCNLADCWSSELPGRGQRMNLGEITVYLEQHPSICVAGAAISTLFVAYLVYRLFFEKKSKVSKGKTKKRSVEKKKQEPVETVVLPKSVSENMSKKTCNLTSPAPKKGERLGTKSLTKSSPMSTLPRKSESPEPVTLSEHEAMEDQWITVVSGKKEPKPGTGSNIKSPMSAVPGVLPGLGNKVSKGNRSNSKHADPVGLREPLVERSSGVPVDADDTEEEWREVRFTRKGGKFRKNE
ncbi:hypothetical protein CLF_101423 [Clonorchis sinensis]|uniref:Uncharacterized protein n=1 Tax=Clonorchis sinensis TaxID=79923 RepID=G7Y5Q3_CLOSI|nr:hypothetical protein CLF_101423 [Clonorchis sinensis]